ncbi:hypothetical protein GCM10007863_35180 [Dyella mobilis]|nr:hypothetical protein GCM10007863_35180 [Dyella mobilis]
MTPNPDETAGYAQAVVPHIHGLVAFPDDRRIDQRERRGAEVGGNDAQIGADLRRCDGAAKPHPLTEFGQRGRKILDQQANIPINGNDWFSATAQARIVAGQDGENVCHDALQLNGCDSIGPPWLCGAAL